MKAARRGFLAAFPIIFVFSAMICSTTQAQAAATVTEFPICTNTGDQYNPKISGNTVVWSDERGIVGYNLATHEEFVIGSGMRYAIGGDTVAWVKSVGNTWSIVGYDLATHTEFPVCDVTMWSGVNGISSNTIVWRDARNIGGNFLGGNYDIYGYDTASHEEFPICTNTFMQSDAAVSGNTVVWTDSRNGNSDVFGFNLLTREEFPICVDPAGQYSPAIDGDIVVWMDYRGGIYGYNLATQEEFLVCDPPREQYDPAISGNTVIWQDDLPGSYPYYAYDIAGCNLLTYDGVSVCSYTASWAYPQISGNTVVWMDYRNAYYTLGIFGEHIWHNTDIYGATIAYIPEPGTIILLAMGVAGLAAMGRKSIIKGV
jgi:beta propeller repeat protein